MEFFRIRRDIPFMKHALILNVLPPLTLIAVVLFLFHKGLYLLVEFTDGMVMEVAYARVADLPKIRGDVERPGYVDVQMQNFGTSCDVMIRPPLRTSPDSRPVALVVQSQQAVTTLNTVNLDAKPQRVEFVGPQMDKELATDGLLALPSAVAGIVIYLSAHFEWRFAVAGVIANLHDVMIILGLFVPFQWEFSLSALAGVLTVPGYPVSKSVVILDRVHEAFHRYCEMSTHEATDRTITSITSRTTITHGSAEMMVVSALVFGGPTPYYLAAAPAIGTLLGIYSSVFVATALCIRLGVKRKGPVRAEEEAGGPKEDDPNFGAQT